MGMTLQNDNELAARFLDLAARSYRDNVYTYSSFLSLAEQEAFFRVESDIRYASPMLFGGNEDLSGNALTDAQECVKRSSSDCERKLVRFGDPKEFGYEEMLPISIVFITPLMAKYADDLTHRDFLGAILNEGIDRSAIGDIFVRREGAAVFCLSSVAELICNELCRVKRTSVSTRLITASELESIGFIQEFEEIHESVGSKRADLVIAKICRLSRTNVKELIDGGLVAVNGRLLLKSEKELEPGDVFTVRGYGKFAYRKDEFISKKGNTGILVDKYK